MIDSKISWTDHTLNFWIGCTKVSDGCKNCYAERDNARRKWTEGWGKGVPRKRTTAAYWKLAERLNLKSGAQVAAGGRRTRIFSGSLCDWLDPEVPIEWLADMLIVISRCQFIDWLLLTKRPEQFYPRIKAAMDSMKTGIGMGREFCLRWLEGVPPNNVWMGTTVENQEMAFKRIPAVTDIKARVWFMSCEPLLGEIDLKHAWPSPYFDWIIVGGESGQKARFMDVDWARKIRDYARENKIAFFMKQLGGTDKKHGNLEDFPDDLRIREFPVP